MPIIKIEFYGINTWNRPVYKGINLPFFYGATDRLFSDPETAKKEIKVKDLTYFGNHFNCEPSGNIVEGLVIVKTTEVIET